MMLFRNQLWTAALAVSFLCAVAWLVLPGECVVVTAGDSDRFLPTSIVGTFLHPFSVDDVYAMYLFQAVTPLILVVLAGLHWRSQFEKVRAATALYAMVLSAAVAFHPYRSFSDAQLIAIIGVWGIVILVAYQSKASPGSALLSLMSFQVVMSEVYSGLGPYRGLPFWMLTVSQSIVCFYGIFHYTRMLRHSVLGRFTEIRRIDPAALARRQALMDQQKRLEGRG
jgi:hypothetical protein